MCLGLDCCHVGSYMYMQEEKKTIPKGNQRPRKSTRLQVNFNTSIKAMAMSCFCLISGTALLWVYNIKGYPLLFIGTPKQPTGSIIAAAPHPTAEQINTSLVSESESPTPDIPPPTPEATPTTAVIQMTPAPASVIAVAYLNRNS